jgi:hypothetical protein
MEEEKRRMQAELEALKSGRTPASSSRMSDSASKLAALEEEKRKMQAELEALKRGKPAESSSKSSSVLKALQQEQEKQRAIDASAKKTNLAQEQLKRLNEMVGGDVERWLKLKTKRRACTCTRHSP